MCMVTLIERAAKNIHDIVAQAIRLGPDKKALVVYDLRSTLSQMMTEAYRAALPDAVFMDFDTVGAAEVLAATDTLTAGDLVVLVQSGSFRLNEFRIRIELFKRGLANIEHVHLERIPNHAQYEAYVDSLAYDPALYVVPGHWLKAKLDNAQNIVVRCAGTTLNYEGGMQPAKLNVGDYTGMTNVGGTFPIGEVFTEANDLAKVNGEAMLFGFAGTDHLIQIHEPFKVTIKDGILTTEECPEDFRKVLDQITATEEVLVREFGLGLNPAVGKHRLLSDITAFERQLGMHLSLGEKHGIYKKPGFNPKKTRYHVDVFVDIERIEVDGEAIYDGGKFLVGV